MRSLPGAVRLYLYATYLFCPVVVLAQTLPHLTSGALLRTPAIVAVTAVLLALLTYAGEMTMLQVGANLTQSVASTAQIAAILLLPQPLPLLTALVAVAASQLTVDKPLFKRAYNVCHTTITVGCTAALCTSITGPLVVLRHGRAVSTMLRLDGTNVGALILLVALYYLLDMGTMNPLLALLEAMSPWDAWRQRQSASLLPEVAASTTGVLAAIAWAYGPLLIVFFVLPVIALRLAFRAIKQAEDRAVALRARGEQLEAVLAVGQRLQLEQPPAELLLPVVEAARAITGAATAAAYLHDPDQPTMLQRIVLTPTSAPDPGASAPAPPAHVPIADMPAAIRVARGTASALVVPLHRDGAGLVGALHLVGVPDDVGRDAHDALAILGTQATIALRNAQSHERALAQASEDGLTGLLNHRAFQTRLAEEVVRAHRHGHPLALIMVDLDDFGMINNTHGHQAGDATLLGVAAALRASLRTSDLAARYGGDEFAAILPETTMEEAVAAAERVRAAIAAIASAGAGASIRIDASIGVATLPLHARGREELIRAADQAAYAAKRAGKGRVGQPEDASLFMGQDPSVLAAQLAHANVATVEALAAAVDAKDPYTRGHSQRVSAYAAALATALGLSEADVARVRLAGLLHDVGKIGVPDAILSKPGALTDDEFDALKRHPVVGESMLAAVPFLREVLPAIRHHHERWDGRGYPDGLVGEGIPRDAAILMVADSFDAMTSSRVYRPALPIEEACRRVREGSGTQFDPHIVRAFEGAVAMGDLLLLAEPGAAPHGGGYMALAG